MKHLAMLRPLFIGVGEVTPRIPFNKKSKDKIEKFFDSMFNGIDKVNNIMIHVVAYSNKSRF